MTPARTYAEAKARGLCVRCKHERPENGLVQCARCLSLLSYRRKPQTTSQPTLSWCDECIACGFHRSDCKVVKPCEP